MERILTPLGWNLLLAALLAIVAWVVGRWPAVRRRPKFLYGLWLLVLVKLVAPPLVALPILLPPAVPESAPVEWSPAPLVVPVLPDHLPTVVVPAAPPPEFQLTDSLREPRFRLFVIVFASLAVTLTLWVRTYRQIRRWQRLLDQTPQAEERFKRLAEGAAVRMGLKRIPDIRLVGAQLIPFLWTARKKFSIVLPVTLAEQLTDEQVLCILMHELAHYRRRDHWGHAFAGFVTSLFWWNPVSWWAWRELRGLQEICCDGLVLQVSAESRRLYAETLFTVLETLQTRKSVQPALSCSFGDSEHLRRRFIMLADTKLTPRLSPLTACVLLAIAVLVPCLPTRAEPTVPEPLTTTPKTVDTAAASQPNRYTIRISIHSKSGENGKPAVEVSSSPDTKLTASRITLHVPALTVAEGQEATVSMKIPEIDGSEEADKGKSDTGPQLTITAKSSPIPEGKISLDLDLKLEPASRFAYNFYPPESPLFLEENQPKKIVFFGPQDDPVQWVEIIINRVKPQSQYQLHGTFHLESNSTEGSQHSSQDFNVITTNTGSVSILLDQLKLAEVDSETSIPSFNMTLNPGSDSELPESFTGEISVVSRKDFKHRVLSRKRNEPFPITLGKSERHVLEEREGKPTFWLEMMTEIVSDERFFSSGVLPPALAPHPQMHVKSHRLPERFWLRPGEPVSAMRSPTRKDFQPIIDHITRNFVPDSWSEKGGYGQYELLLLNRTLVVFSTADVHNQIAPYLDSIRPEPASEKGKYTLSLNFSLTGPGLFGVVPQSVNQSTIIAHNLVTPTGKDPLGRPIATREDYEKFIATLKGIEPKSWDSNDGKGKIEYSLLLGTIYFQNTSEVSARIHNHCSELLSKNLAAHPPLPLPAVPVIQPVSNEVPDSHSNKPEPPSVPATPTSDNPQSKVDSQKRLYLETFPVSDLIEVPKDRSLTTHPLIPKDLEPLAEEIRQEVAPSTWGTANGQGMIVPCEYGDDKQEKHLGLVIRQTREVHDQIANYIKEKRRRQTDNNKPATPTP